MLLRLSRLHLSCVAWDYELTAKVVLLGVACLARFLLRCKLSRRYAGTCEPDVRVAWRTPLVSPVGPLRPWIVQPGGEVQSEPAPVLAGAITAVASIIAAVAMTIVGLPRFDGRPASGW